MIQQKLWREWWIASFCALLSGCVGPDEPLEEIIERSYPIDPRGTFTLTSTDGSVEIYGSPKPEVHLEATKRAYTAARLNRLSVKVSAQPDSISVETLLASATKKWSLSDRSGTVDYVVVIPQTSRISRLELNNGEILVAGMEAGNAHIKLGNGRLFVRNCFCDVHAVQGTGALMLIYDWWNSRKFSADAEITDGNVFAILPSDASFHLIADAANGKIDNDFVEKEQRTGATVTTIDTVVGTSPEATIHLHAIDGNIKIVEANP
jgi:hypothetical protein